MILTSLEVWNWRNIAYFPCHRLHPELNVIVGANESGKSSLFEALYFGFFESAKGKGQHKLGLINWFFAHPPRVRIGFQKGEHFYCIDKQFTKNPFTRLTTPGGELFDDEAEAKLKELLELNYKAARGLPLNVQELGLWPLLWVRQGTAFKAPQEDFNAESQRKLQDILKKNIDAAFIGPRGRAVIATIQKQYALYWTPTGREGRLLQGARDKLARLKEAKALQQDHWQKAFSWQKRLGELEQAISACRHEEQELARQWEQALELGEKVKGIQVNLATYQQNLKAQEELARQIKSELEHRDKVAHEVSSCQRRLASLSQKLASLEALLSSKQAALQPTEDKLQALEESLQSQDPDLSLPKPWPCLEVLALKPLTLNGQKLASGETACLFLSPDSCLRLGELAEIRWQATAAGQARPAATVAWPHADLREQWHAVREQRLKIAEENLALKEERAQLNGALAAENELANSLAAKLAQLPSRQVLEEQLQAAHREQAELLSILSALKEKLSLLGGGQMLALSERLVLKRQQKQNQELALVTEQRLLSRQLEQANFYALDRRLKGLEEEITYYEQEYLSLMQQAQAVRKLKLTCERLEAESLKQLSLPVAQVVNQLLRPIFPKSQVALSEQWALEGLAFETAAVVAPFACLSQGAKEQLAILTRLGLALILAGDSRLPILLDDALVNSDKARLETMFKIFEQVTDRLQLIVLSCHEDFVKSPAAHMIRLEPSMLARPHRS